MFEDRFKLERRLPILLHFPCTTIPAIGRKQLYHYLARIVHVFGKSFALSSMQNNIRMSLVFSEANSSLFTTMPDRYTAERENGVRVHRLGFGADLNF